MVKSKNKIILAAGGTGGHLYGALSLSEELKMNGYEVFLFTDKRIENLIKDFDINFLIVAYRGFSGNKGKPTEEGLYQDARDTLKWLNKQNVEDEKIIIYGESLGTGVSTEVAQNKNYAGLILESPFTSMVDAGKHYYFYLPVSLLLKDRYETIKKLKNIKIPILVMHGENDKIVPFKMGKKVFSEDNEPKYFYFPKDDDHMMEYNENLLEALNKFLKSI